MPFGPGTYGNGGQGLAGPALQRQGIPEGGVVPTAAPDTQALSEIMSMLQGGEVGAERFMQLLSLLAGGVVPQMDQPQQPPQEQLPEDPMAALFGGQGGPARPTAGGASIADLLG